MQLSGFQESKSVGRGEGSRKAVQGQSQGRCSGKARITSQTLPPAESPMRALWTGSESQSKINKGSAGHCRSCSGKGPFARSLFGHLINPVPLTRAVVVSAAFDRHRAHLEGDTGTPL